MEFFNISLCTWKFKFIFSLENILIKALSSRNKKHLSSNMFLRGVISFHYKTVLNSLIFWMLHTNTVKEKHAKHSRMKRCNIRMLRELWNEKHLSDAFLLFSSQFGVGFVAINIEKQIQVKGYLEKKKVFSVQSSPRAKVNF